MSLDLKILSILGYEYMLSIEFTRRKKCRPWMDILKRDGFHTLIVGVIIGCQKLQRLCFAGTDTCPKA